MGFKLKRLKKSFKKTIKSVGKVAMKAVKYAAPVVGTVVGGPLGGLAGTALSGVAATHRAKNKTAAVLRTVKYGAGVAAAGGLLNVAGGSNFFGSNVLGSVGNIFGGGSSKVNTGLDDALLTPEDAGGRSSTGTLDALANAVLTGGNPTVDAGQLGTPPYFPQGTAPTNPETGLAGSLDSMFGAGSGGAGVADEGGGFMQSPLFWIAAGVVVLYVLYNA